MTRICRTCQNELPATNAYFNERDGRLETRCRDCAAAIKRKARVKPNPNDEFQFGDVWSFIENGQEKRIKVCSMAKDPWMRETRVNGYVGAKRRTVRVAVLRETGKLIEKGQAPQ